MMKILHKVAIANVIVNNFDDVGVMRQAKQEIQHVRAHRRWDRLMFVYTDVADKLIYILSGGWHDRLRLKRGDK